LKVSPAAVTPTVGAFEPQLVDAYLRGRRLQLDVMGASDYWAFMPLSVDEARQRLGITDHSKSEENHASQSIKMCRSDGKK